MDYEFNQIKIDSLYPWLFEKFLKENADGGYYEELTDEEAAAWGADKVLRRYDMHGSQTNFWVIIKDDCFSVIRISEENLTAGIKTAIAEIFEKA